MSLLNDVMDIVRRDIDRSITDLISIARDSHGSPLSIVEKASQFELVSMVSEASGFLSILAGDKLVNRDIYKNPTNIVKSIQMTNLPDKQKRRVSEINGTLRLCSEIAKISGETELANTATSYICPIK